MVFAGLGYNSLQNASAAKEAIAALHFFHFAYMNQLLKKSDIKNAVY